MAVRNVSAIPAKPMQELKGLEVFSLWTVAFSQKGSVNKYIAARSFLDGLAFFVLSWIIFCYLGRK